jgi:hypothetical protein
MPYTLVKEITKNSSNPWFIETLVISSIDATPDSRDRVIYNESERNAFVVAARALRDGINDYVGWKREYVNDNQMNLIYLFDTESSARLYHSRSIQTPAFPEVTIARILQRKKMRDNQVYDVYTTNWKLYDSDGNLMEL